MSLIVDEHREYLGDRARISAFERAIAETVRAGDVVADLGSGTGILALLALRAGAARVYAIDEGGIIELARDICRANGFDGRIHFIKDLSTRAGLPERVDAVVTDQIGRFGLEAGAMQYLADARRRWLKPGGPTVPCSITLHMAPVERADMWERIEFWNQRPAGFDFGPARRVAVSTGYPLTLAPSDVLAPPSPLLTVALGTGTAPMVEGAYRFTVERAGTLHGIGGWFEAMLSPGVAMSNSPFAAHRINRRNVFFPIERPVALAPGDRVSVSMRILAADSVYSWTVEVASGGGSRVTFRHSTFGGMLIAAEDLARTRPAFTPELTAAGAARKSVLDLCDGRRPLADIEDEVFRRHPALFGSRNEAASFVAEVVTRYAR